MPQRSFCLTAGRGGTPTRLEKGKGATPAFAVQAA
ncbi:hypothetical protein HNQ10_000527 [Deinococcus metallilatus]|uniref:Uncharacterized protein n=1 Tax=Deinococcus metallilatus TaxID=1211322 RepID=A0ABR6MP47_9DEIO|nr:hypothetical protein [Deinococcus metallilatus]